MNTTHIKPVIGIAAAALAAAVTGLGAAHAETTTELASIKSAMHGKCLEAPAAGSDVAMFPCGGPTAPRQRWAYDPVGGRVSLNGGATCLDATDGGWISPVIVRPCGAGGPTRGVSCRREAKATPGWPSGCGHGWRPWATGPWSSRTGASPARSWF